MDGESTAAAVLARLVRKRVPRWEESSDEPGHWQWTDPDPDYVDDARMVIIDGRDRLLRVLPVGDGVHVGPSIVGRHRGVTVNVTLASCVDGTDMQMVLAALEAFDVLPEAGR